MTTTYEYVLLGLAGIIAALLLMILWGVGVCEMHLKALHVKQLGQVTDRSPEGMAERRRELGMDDRDKRFVKLASLVLVIAPALIVRCCR